jgi:hypothetical protein
VDELVHTGISIALLSYDDQLKVSGSADSNWLSKEELIQIFELVPKEVESMASVCPFEVAKWKYPPNYNLDKKKS